MSQLEEKVSKGLENIGYTGCLSKLPQLKASIEVGIKDRNYTELIHFLTNEIRTLLSIDEEVNTIASPEDSVAFVMEITSFLRELNCPYTTLTQGVVSERLQNYSDRLLLLDYLISELMAARIIQEKKPQKKIELKLKETPEGADIRQILQTLRFPKPPSNITIKQLFDKLHTTVPLVLKKAGADLVGKAIFDGFLSDKQWETLNNVQKDLNNEYKIRREMLLTRLDVTIQSFQWSDKTKGKESEFEKIYHDNRKLLHAEPNIDLSDIIAARTDLAISEKTSSASVRTHTKTPLNKVIIGKVPDRGGRSWEQAPPPPEMPSWQQNRLGPPAGISAQRGQGNNRRGNRTEIKFNHFQGRNSGNFQDTGSRDDSDNNQRRYSGNSRGSYESRGNKSYYNRGGNRHNYDNRGETANNYDYRDYYEYNNYDRRDSGGYSGGNEFQQHKRPKTYDNFQANKTTYADQYVQEDQHNQHYQQRGGGGRSFQRGRSNYYRGGGGGYR